MVRSSPLPPAVVTHERRALPNSLRRGGKELLKLAKFASSLFGVGSDSQSRG